MTRVLVVEDDPWLQWMIADDLADRGYEIMTAQDGLEALERIGDSRPDVMVLDMMLPRLDGWELTHRYQTVAGGDVIPIVVVSALPGPDPADDGSGVRQWFSKPFDIEEVARAVAQLSRHQPARAAVATG